MGALNPWDQMGEAYARWITPTTEFFASGLIRLLGPAGGRSLLDVATGTGALAGFAADVGWQVTAIDNAPSMVDSAADRLAPYQSAVAMVMDAAEKLKFDDNVFDVAASEFGATIFGENTERTLAEMVRVTKPGGRVAVIHWATVHGAPPFAVLFRAMAAELDMPELLTQGMGLLTKDELAQTLGDVGLEDVLVERAEVNSVMPDPEHAVDKLRPLFGAFPFFRDLDAAGLARVRAAFARTVRDMRTQGQDADRAVAHIAFGHKN